MTIGEATVIGLGGFIGAVLRFFISARLNKGEGLPVGTLTVNWIGSFVIGLLIGLELPKVWTIFLVSGLLGSLTTFSTLMKEVLQLWKSGQRKRSILYSVWTFGLGIVVAYLGIVFGRLL